jgi:hypothetical protein
LYGLDFPRLIQSPMPTGRVSLSRPAWIFMYQTDQADSGRSASFGRGRSSDRPKCRGVAFKGLGRTDSLARASGFEWALRSAG